MYSWSDWLAILFLVLICVGATWIILQALFDLVLAVLKLTGGL